MAALCQSGPEHGAAMVRVQHTYSRAMGSQARGPPNSFMLLEWTVKKSTQGCCGGGGGGSLVARAEAPEVKPVNVKSAAIGQNASLHRQPARLLGGCTALPDLLQSSPPQPASPVASVPGNCTSEESRAAHTSSPSREEEEAGACSPVLLF